jgi:hypothetical protein
MNAKKNNGGQMNINFLFSQNLINWGQIKIESTSHCHNGELFSSLLTALQSGFGYKRGLPGLDFRQDGRVSCLAV